VDRFAASRKGRPVVAGRSEGIAMSETFWIIGEIIVGIALLGLLSAVVTAVMVPFLNKLSKRSGAAEILGSGMPEAS
jgi:hypothetical protein